MQISVVVAAGGRGERLGSGTPKQFRMVQGKMVLEHTLDALSRWDRVGEIVPVLPAGVHETIGRELCRKYQKVTELAAAGRQRTDSVRNGVRLTDSGYEYVAVHDGVRPVLSEGLLERLLAAAAGGAPCVVPGIAVTDTIKEVRGGEVVRTCPREDLRMIQTPQLFRRTLLLAALEKEGPPVTDEATRMEACGHRVLVVEGDPRNLKLTRAEDLRWLEIYLEGRTDADRDGI